MPEYLSPGVYIEELPSALRAIEGVSTSTAAFVGHARRGPVPGFLWRGPPPTFLPLSPLPFAPVGGFVLTPDPSPVFVSSFAEFQRTFGAPMPIAAPGDPDFGYLGHAVRAFFDNGGKRAYVARIVGTGATPGQIAVPKGQVYRLTRSARITDNPPKVYLNSTRGIKNGTLLKFVRESDGAVLIASANVASYDVQANTVTLTGALTANLEPTDVWVSEVGSALAAGGPIFIARNPGEWGNSISVQIAPSDRPPVTITGPVAPGSPVVPVLNVSSLYIGGAVEIDHNGGGRSVHQIADIDPGTRQVTLTAPMGGAALTTPGATLRMLEIDILVSDNSGVAPTESYRGMAWTQGVPADVRRHYAWTINANSRLVWVKPPAAEGFHLVDQPMTIDGFPQSPAGVGNIGADGSPAADADWVGLDLGPGQRSGIESLKDLSDVSIILAPGQTTQTVQLALIAQCENMRYRFAVLDGQRDPTGGALTSILTHRNVYDTSFAAYYQPWISVQVAISWSAFKHCRASTGNSGDRRSSMRKPAG